MKLRKAEEFFYTDDNGKRQDMMLHEPMLQEGDDDAAKAVSEAVMRRQGLTDAQIETLLGKSPQRKMKALRKRSSDQAIFMQQCVQTLMDESGGDEFEAYQICEMLWEEGVDIDELGD